MLDKKVLICEDNEGMASMLARFFKQEDIKPVKLVRSSELVLSEIGYVVEREQPDYMVIDGLDGKCLEVAEKARAVKPDIVFAIFSGEPTLISLARESGYNAFEKPLGLDNLIEYFKRQT